MRAFPGATSDLRRGRQLALAALAAAVAIAVALLAAPSSRLRSPGPLARPHVQARVACTGCHGESITGPAPGQACARCHSSHLSTRPAHQALAARGALGCTSCHVAHGAAEGVTFSASGEGLRWRADVETRVPLQGPPGTTVALVPIAACTPCHDASRAGDPLQACVAAGGAAGIDVCLDEHPHGPARFVAWEAARHVLAASTPPPETPARGPWLWVGSGLAAGALAFAGMAIQRRRRRAGETRPVPVVPVRVRLPVIDAARCLGCHACVDVCPFDVLSVERHIAVLARPDECCGVGSCEQACPNGSLRLAAEGELLADRPRVDAHLESLDRRGVFLAGDLTGVPLIRNAIAQGARVVERVAAEARAGKLAGSRDPAWIDLLVAGAGPAGLAAALRAKELGLACVVLEQSTVAATIRAFPRGKLVHDPPIDLPLEGGLWLRESTKEELVAQWTRIVRAHRLDVREQHRVTAVTGDPGTLVVTAETPDGPRSLRAARVLLATGRRGTPRQLEAEILPAAVTRVVYALSDARALAGRHVLVVGLGDSAMEAVVALARQPGTTVTVSYRGSAFSRGKARNIDEVRRLAASGRVRLVFGSTVEHVDAEMARLRTAEGRVETVAVDVVLALLGGKPSRGLLDAIGVRLEG